MGKKAFLLGLCSSKKKNTPPQKKPQKQNHKQIQGEQLRLLSPARVLRKLSIVVRGDQESSRNCTTGAGQVLKCWQEKPRSNQETRVQCPRYNSFRSFSVVISCRGCHFDLLPVELFPNPADLPPQASWFPGCAQAIRAWSQGNPNGSG